MIFISTAHRTFEFQSVDDIIKFMVNLDYLFRSSYMSV